jgi:prepilin-type N-terminal cleavage/methylation domain-containing protein
MNNYNKYIKTSRTKKKTGGFSLIELAAVIAVLAILVAILVPSFLQYNERSRAQKDASAMDEVVSAVQLAMADGKCFDEMLLYSCTNNYLTYTDSSGTYGRQAADAEFWAADGEGRATTITLNPQRNDSNKTFYYLKDAIVNDITYGNGSYAEKREMEGNQIKNNQCYWPNSKTIDGEEAGFTYKRVKSNIGDAIAITSQTYRNSSFTIFIHFKQVDGTTIADVYGAFNGTNLYNDAPASNGSGDHLIDPDTGAHKPGGITESNQTESSLIGSGVLYGDADYKKENINPTFKDGTLSFTHLGKYVANNIGTAKSIIFTDIGAEEGTDVSQERNKSILAWVKNGELFVSATKAGQNIKVPSECVAGFSGDKYPGYKKVEYMQLRPLDVSEVENMGQMFKGFGKKAESVKIYGFDSWNTSNLKNMTEMFSYVGYDSPGAIVINGLDGLDTENVTTLHRVFYYMGSNKATEVRIDGISKWDTGNVTDMIEAFGYVGQGQAKEFIVDLSNWDVSSVLNMQLMFSYAGLKAETWDVGNLKNWDVSSVRIFDRMFYGAGFYANSWHVGELDNWKTHKATNLTGMFASCGSLAGDWSVGNLDNWDVSNVTTMNGMFTQAGMKTKNWTVGNLNNWDVSHVKTMKKMFDSAGANSETWSIGDISEWDVGNVTNMSGMFQEAAYYTPVFNIGNIGKWDVSKVNDMSYMFYFNSAEATSHWYIGNLSNWDVSNVKTMESMFAGAAARGRFYVGNLNNWDVSNVTNMREMFAFSGSLSNQPWQVGDLSNWDVSNVTNMNSMFSLAGQGTKSFNLGDLSGWDVSNVTDMNSMFNWTACLSKEFYVGDIGQWDVDNVTDFTNMFNNGGRNANYSLNLTSWNVRSKPHKDFALTNEAKIQY